jgi:hypothetical protein
MSESDRQFSWRLLFAKTILFAFAYAFMEWLFFATQQSFMDAFSLTMKLELWLMVGLAATLIELPLLILLRLLGLIPGILKRREVFLRLGAVIPAIVGAVLTLLLIDNFTNTILHFGIVTSRSWLRVGYAVLMLLILAFWYRQVIRSIRPQGKADSPGENPAGSIRMSAWQGVQCSAALAMLVLSSVVGASRVAAATHVLGGETARLERTPHIILLGGDGTIAANMSLYGYERGTTPNLVKLAETGLLAEDNFTNAAHSTGSVFSILTGKYPADTRLLYSPNILQGEDAVQHLPGILQRAGYMTVQIGFPYYLDAYDVNMQEGFDIVNGRSLGQSEIAGRARQYHLEDLGYFLPRLWERISERIRHIFFFRQMQDPYREVIQAVDPNTQLKIGDLQRIDQLVTLIRSSDTPIFVHVHLMGTHGPKFYPKRQVFSAGMVQNEDWVPEFFDDAVLEYDAYIGRIMNVLESDGLMDQTILIVYSDHANAWRADDRIPLLFHFPNGDFAGRITDNTQNLDVAPTVLEYLGLETPAWMSGQSLIGDRLSPLRPIISAGVIGINCEPPDWWCEIDANRTSSTFEQFGYIQLVVCQGMYRLELESNSFSQQLVPGHTNPCSQAHLPTEEQARQMIRDHLSTYEFDVSTLE